tara:strand:+ start:1234 stop:1848 length:615 start_codon:yes stop_codon:yes gene_type:complete
MNTEDSQPTTLEKLELFIKDLSSHMEEGRLLSARAKALQKDISKGKNMRKKRVVNEGEEAPKRLSALQKPVEISNELCEFLGFEKNTTHARQEVTTCLNKYIKDNDLQNPENRRYILLSGSAKADALRVLLREPDQPVTFFNIQRYLKVHYPPSEKEKKALLEQVNVTPASTEVVKDSAVVEESNEKKDVQKAPKKVTKRSPRS